LYLIKKKRKKKSLRTRGTIGINCGALCLKAKKMNKALQKRDDEKHKLLGDWTSRYVLDWIIIVIPLRS
jgi:hypothetical protein